MALQDDVEHALVLVRELVLVQLAEAQTDLEHHIAAALFDLTAEDFQQGGFAAAVRTDEPVAIAIGELDGDVFEEGLGTKLDRDVRGGQHAAATLHSKALPRRLTMGPLGRAGQVKARMVQDREPNVCTGPGMAEWAAGERPWGRIGRVCRPLNEGMAS